MCFLRLAPAILQIWRIVVVIDAAIGREAELLGRFRVHLQPLPEIKSQTRKKQFVLFCTPYQAFDAAEARKWDLSGIQALAGYVGEGEPTLKALEPWHRPGFCVRSLQNAVLPIHQWETDDTNRVHQLSTFQTDGMQFSANLHHTWTWMHTGCRPLPTETWLPPKTRSEKARAYSTNHSPRCVSRLLFIYLCFFLSFSVPILWSTKFVTNVLVSRLERRKRWINDSQSESDLNYSRWQSSAHWGANGRKVRGRELRNLFPRRIEESGGTAPTLRLAGWLAGALRQLARHVRGATSVLKRRLPRLQTQTWLVSLSFPTFDITRHFVLDVQYTKDTLKTHSSNTRNRQTTICIYGLH